MVPEDLRFAIGAIVAAVALASMVGAIRVLHGRARVAWVAGVLGWLAVTGVLAERGLFARADGPPVLPMFVALAIASSLVIVRSRVGGALATLPLAALIGLHVFRLPLELAMHAGAGRGIPIEMTFAGYNFDILTGITAIPVAVLAAFGRCPTWLVRAWSALGLSCLLVILVVAAATLPRVHAFGTDPRHLNTWVAAVPFVWVPMLLVPVAVMGHLLVLRANLRLTARAPTR